MSNNVAKTTVLYSAGLINLLALLWLAFIGFLILQMVYARDWFIVIINSLLFLGVLRYWIFSPQSITLRQDVVYEKRFFSERSIKACNIKSIEINQRIINTGRGYRQQDYIDIQSKNDDVISIEYIRRRTPDIYKILLGWHEKHKANLSQ